MYVSDLFKETTLMYVWNELNMSADQDPWGRMYFPKYIPKRQNHFFRKQDIEQNEMNIAMWR